MISYPRVFPDSICHNLYYYPSSFFPNPTFPPAKTLHRLDIKRVLLFYLHCTCKFHKCHSLFICFAGPCRGHAASSQTLFHWVVQTNCVMNMQALLALCLFMLTPQGSEPCPLLSMWESHCKMSVKGCNMVLCRHVCSSLQYGHWCQMWCCFEEGGSAITA